KKKTNQTGKGENMGNFKSVTEEVRGIILEVISDGKEHSRKELSGIVGEKITQKGLTDGIFSGAVKLMVNGGVILVNDRGVYQINAQNAQLSLEKKVSCILNHTKNQLESSCNVNILGFNQETISVAEKVNEVICYLIDAISYFDGSEPEIEKQEPEKEKKDSPVRETPLPEKKKEPEAVKKEPEAVKKEPEKKTESKSMKEPAEKGKVIT
ncbi:MAG: hypothetical protein RR593_01290, partial [Hungatella sp.]